MVRGVLGIVSSALVNRGTSQNVEPKHRILDPDPDTGSTRHLDGVRWGLGAPMAPSFEGGGER